jgi:hypothetical protein
MKRKKEFKDATAKPFTTTDSRFGLRKFFLNSKEKSSIAIYKAPGKGPNGEHQN